MTTTSSDPSAVLRFNPSHHAHPWVALRSALDARGPAVLVVIDGPIDGAVGPLDGDSADVESRRAVVTALGEASLVSLLILRGPAIHGDEALALALACDIRWAAPGAGLEAKALGRGALPFADVSHLAAQRLGAQPALALSLRGAPLSSGQALAWGLIDEVVPDHELDARTDALIERLASVPRALLSETKALLRVQDPAQARRLEAEARVRLSS